MHYEFYVYRRFIFRYLREAKDLDLLVGDIDRENPTLSRQPAKNGRPCMVVSEFESEYPSQNLAFVSHGIAIEHLSIKEIGESEVPEPFRDPQAFQRLFDSEPDNWSVWQAGSPKPAAR